MLGPRLNNSWKLRSFAIALFLILCTFLFTSANPDAAPYRAWKTTSELSKYRKSSHKGIQASHLTQHPFKEPIENFEKPLDFRIVALVFFGRREYVSILDCYLQVRSLKGRMLEMHD